MATRDRTSKRLGERDANRMNRIKPQPTEAERMRYLRRLHGLSIEEMALGLSREAPLLERVESGRQGISRALAVDIANRFDISVHWLLIGDGPIEAKHLRTSNTPPAAHDGRKVSPLPAAGTSPRQPTGSAVGGLSGFSASPEGFLGEGPGRAYQTDRVAPCLARPEQTTRLPLTERIAASLGWHHLGKLPLHRIAFWTGEVIGAACLFIMLIAGIFIGSALQ